MIFFSRLTYSSYCIGSGLVLFEKEKWGSIAFRDLYKSAGEFSFSNKPILINFLYMFETYIHNEKQQVAIAIEESVVDERKWTNNYNVEILQKNNVEILQKNKIV